MSTPAKEIDLPSGLADRRRELYPQLTDAEITRIGHFGQVRHYERGEQLFAAGEPAPGMFVVLKGAVLMSQRDGLGRVVPLGSRGPGQFLAEVATLSGATALVDAYAEDDVETLLVSPQQVRALIIADADLGERIERWPRLIGQKSRLDK